MKTVDLSKIPIEELRRPIEKEPKHGSPETMIAMPWPEFMERTRRIHKLMKARKAGSNAYARGLETRREDFA